MAQVKISDLSGAALDWAVAQCLIMSDGYRERGLLVHRIGYGQPMPAFSTDWAQGGPIIEREFIYADRLMGGQWLAAKRNDEGDSFLCAEHGPTPLIAAMRCFVASKLGDVVEIPEERC